MNRISQLSVFLGCLLVSACASRESGTIPENYRNRPALLTTSIANWQSCLDPSSVATNHLLSIAAQRNAPPVSEEFMKALELSLRIRPDKGEQFVPTISSRLYEQRMGVSQADPAELIIDFSGIATSGWNKLSMAFTEPVTWDGQLGISSVDVSFRNDSAPTVSRLAFGADNKTVTMAFSELVAENLAASPEKFVRLADTNDIELICTFQWGQPEFQWGTFTCKDVPTRLSISITGLTSQCSGKDVGTIDGQSFKLSVDRNALPIGAEGDRIWRPAN